MSDRRGKNVNWAPLNENGNAPTWERVGITVLMDIRDELQTLNGVLRCPSFQRIPRHLARIAANTTRPKRKKKAEAKP